MLGYMISQMQTFLIIKTNYTLIRLECIRKTLGRIYMLYLMSIPTSYALYELWCTFLVYNVWVQIINTCCISIEGQPKSVWVWLINHNIDFNKRVYFDLNKQWCKTNTTSVIASRIFKNSSKVTFGCLNLWPFFTFKTCTCFFTWAQHFGAAWVFFIDSPSQVTIVVTFYDFIVPQLNVRIFPGIYDFAIDFYFTLYT